MSVKIVSDSACDMTTAEAQAKGVTLLPLKTIIDGTEYLDGVTITAEEFYKKLDACKTLPSTSQVSPHEFAEVYERETGAGNEAVVITISSGLSGTAQSAVIAAQEFPGKVWVVDSENVAVGEQILVEYALRLRDAGLSAEAIAKELNEKKKKICLVARLDTLEYLMRGGRLSRSGAIVGMVLNIKPVVGIENGGIVVLGKARGSKNSNNLLSEMIKKKGGIDFSMPFMLTYSGADDALLKEYIENSRQIWEGQADSLPLSVIGSTIGTHAGPGAIGVAFFSKAD